MHESHPAYAFAKTISHIIYIYTLRRGSTDLTLEKRNKKYIYFCAMRWIKNTLAKEYQLCVVDGFDKGPF